MKTLERIWLTIAHLTKVAWSLPGMIATTGKRRKERELWNERELERLDRIRNPSKYRCR